MDRAPYVQSSAARCLMRAAAPSRGIPTGDARSRTGGLGVQRGPRRLLRRSAARQADAHADRLMERLSSSAITEQEVMEELASLPLQTLLAAAAAARNAGHPTTVTFSPKVFLPLTRLCRDACGYCTFAAPPSAGRRAFMTLDEVLAVARAGAAQGCTEALFTLGDKPELAYPEAAAELVALGHADTLSYVAAAAGAVLRETGLLPHINAGVMGEAELRRLRGVSVSQGLMLESLSERLLAPGGPHHACPDKEPAARLATLEAAGRARVPFTTGLLVGIGETRAERVAALLAVRESHRRHGHVQEVIVQNFRAKAGTAMAGAPEPPLAELLWSVAVARLLLGPGMSIQAPPNLTDDARQGGAPSGWAALLDAGVNDWGGVSPVTRDYVNPERPWPHLRQLAAATAASGRALLPRLPVYPRYLRDSTTWLDASAGRDSPAAAALRAADSAGLARGSSWSPGAAEAASTAPDGTLDGWHAAARSAGEAGPSGRLLEGVAPAPNGRRSSVPLPRRRPDREWKVEVGPRGLLEGCGEEPAPSGELARLLQAVLHGGHELEEREVELLFAARGDDYDAVCAAADELRRRTCGDEVTYVVNRNINYTNICTYSCAFCAFSKGKAAEELRGAPYLLPEAEVERRAAEAWARGATEVCMQGGIHPDFTGDTYLRLLAAAKRGAPDIHVHAFSPLEVATGAASLSWTLERYLAALRDAGLGSLPGTAAEVLDDAVRAEICPDKLSSAEWLEVVETAHSVGLRTTSTIMFGHSATDGPAAWARHLVALRTLQRRTGGLTEFVPLPFVHMESPIYLKGRARRGPTLRECVLVHAAARLVLTPAGVANIQASWVKMGPERAADLLAAGCNDMGGSLMGETITRAAGAAHGQELPPAEMDRLIVAAGRTPQQRTTLYGRASEGQVARSLGAAPLLPV